MSATTRPVTYTYHTASVATGLGLTKLNELVAIGALDARKVGRKVLITAESLQHFIEGLPKATIKAPSKKAA